MRLGHPGRGRLAPSGTAGVRMAKPTLTPRQRRAAQISTLVVGLSIMVRMCIGFQEQNDAALGGRDDDRESTATTDAPTTTAEPVDGDEDDTELDTRGEADGPYHFDVASGFGFDLDPSWTAIDPPAVGRPSAWCVDAPRPPCASVEALTTNGGIYSPGSLGDYAEEAAADQVASYRLLEREEQVQGDDVQVVLAFEGTDADGAPVRRLWVARIGELGGLILSFSADPETFTALEPEVRPLLLTLEAA